MRNSAKLGTRKYACVWMAAAVALAAEAVPAPAQNKQKNAEAANALSDAEVVASMKKGIDFLLSQRKGDNWETGKDTDRFWGGETALVVYALLHAQQSLADDPEAAAKIHQRSENLAPAIEFLKKLEPKDTYTAGLQACALSLTTKRAEEKGVLNAVTGLNASRDYLLTAMGASGGYTYTAPGANGNVGFVQAWKTYFEAWARGSDKKAIDEAKKTLIERAKGLTSSFGGVDLAVQALVRDIRERGVAAKAARDDRGMKLADAEYRELMKVSTEFPKGSGTDYAKSLAEARKKLADAEKAFANGATKDVERKDKDGKEIKDGNGNKIVDKVPKTKEELQRDLDWARKGVANAEFEAKNKFNPIGDLSNAQYGTLGAWALVDSEYRIELPTAYWQVQDRFWRLLQQPDGTWSYSVDQPAEGRNTTTMTVAGIASLFITQEFVDTELRLVPKPDKNIENGLAWLTKSFRPMAQNMYYMYGVERVGLASGLKYFGTTDWYRAGAADVIKLQAGDGSWNGGFHGAEKNISTAYAIMFLARGRNPIVFNKLEYKGPWNARPRDNANLTHWMSKGFERPINWQTVNLQVNAEDWMDAPVLLITGSQDPGFTPEDIAKLRAYVEAGGTIFSTADGGEGKGKAFTEAMKKVIVEVMDKKYEFKEVDKSHAIFTGELWRPVKSPARMLEMSNGVRDVWFHSLEDMGASWQMRANAQVDHFIVPSNIGFYATGREKMRTKLQTLNILASKAAPVRTIEVARLDHVGNADPEPGAWRRMAKLAQAEFKTDLKVSNVKFADLDPKKFKMAHITGTTSFTLNAGDLAALKAYLEGGGVLFADSAGGSTDFSNSVLNLMKQLYPNNAPSPLAPDHPVIAGTMADGESVAEIRMRKYAVLKGGAKDRTPKLDAITVNGRIAVIFSPYDVTSGFLGTSTWGNVGYTPESAQGIARNILLYVNDPASLKTSSAAPAGGAAVITK